MPCRRLEREGFDVRRIGVDEDGVIDLAAAGYAIDRGTALVTIIHAQNEIGTLEPVVELAEAARKAEAPIHVDTSQSLGKVPVDVAAWGVDALTLAGHKLYAPKGIGALFLRSGHVIPSVLDGAGQEGGRRPGTENVPYIVGLGRACRIARERLTEDAIRMAALKERLWQALASGVSGLRRLGGSRTLPNTLSVLFPGAVGNDLLAAAPAIAASTGSACHAGCSAPSAIILALGVPPVKALGAVRLSLGRATDHAQVDMAAAALIDAMRRSTP
jgi:cysteine desulfurase